MLGIFNKNKNKNERYYLLLVSQDQNETLSLLANRVKLDKEKPLARYG